MFRKSLYLPRPLITIFITIFFVTFFIVFFGVGEVYAQGTRDPRRDPAYSTYLLNMSDAYNQMELKNYSRAGALVGDYLRLGPYYADAYLIMGEILLKKKFYSQAKSYFDDAEKGQSFLILPESVVRLYWNQVKALSRSEEMDLLDPERKSIVFDIEANVVNEERLEEILQKLIEYANGRKSDYYREQLGRAYFMLGRVWYPTRPLRGMETFLEAAQRGFLVKSANLYLAYFFAIQSQGVIDQVYQGNSKPPPQKDRAFIHYYRNYLEGQEDEALRKVSIPEPEYVAMEVTTDAYYKQLQK